MTRSSGRLAESHEGTCKESQVDAPRTFSCQQDHDASQFGRSHERDHEAIVEVAQTAVYQRPEGIVNAVQFTPDKPHSAEGETPALHSASD